MTLNPFNTGPRLHRERSCWSRGRGVVRWSGAPAPQPRPAAVWALQRKRGVHPHRRDRRSRAVASVQLPGAV